MVLLDEFGEQSGRGIKGRIGDHPDLAAGQPEVVPLSDLAHVATRVAHGHRHLAGDHRIGRPCHRGLVVLGRALRVIGQQRGEPLANAACGHHPDGLACLGVNLPGHGDDVAVVG